MKKILFTLICALTAVSLTGCMRSGGTQLENISTSDAPKADSVKASDYENNLDGLEKYFIALNYIPEETEPTEMMYKVIGAIAGDRYSFAVNNSNVIVELYEYEPDKLGEEGKRVIGEVKEKGKFHVFDGDIADNVTYPAVLSDNGKYLMLYSDGSDSDDNIKRKSDIENALKAFYKN